LTKSLKYDIILGKVVMVSPTIKKQKQQNLLWWKQTRFFKYHENVQKTDAGLSGWCHSNYGGGL